MKITLDTELDGTAITFDSFTEIVAEAKRADPGSRRCRSSSGSWSDLSWAYSWDAIENRLTQPWETELGFMEKAANEIRKAIVEPPVSIRRQRRWSENDGELDVDRALRGTPELFHESYRAKRPRVQNVVVTCYLGQIASVSGLDLMWRAAAAVVAVDLLEEAGYSCEVWGHNFSRGVFTSERSDCFTAYRIKESGDPVDVDGMIKALTPWLFRTAVFAAWEHRGQINYGYGRTSETVDKDRWFSRHTNVDSSSERIAMPAVVGQYDAVKAVCNIIQSI